MEQHPDPKHGGPFLESQERSVLRRLLSRAVRLRLHVVIIAISLASAGWKLYDARIDVRPIPEVPKLRSGLETVSVVEFHGVRVEVERRGSTERWRAPDASVRKQLRPCVRPATCTVAWERDQRDRIVITDVIGAS